MSEFPAISELVPHGEPMLALEELLEWRPGFAKARLNVQSDNQFVRDGSLDTLMTFEYMAQTVAACLGMESRSGGSTVRVGMVIASRSMTIERPSIAVGEELFFEANLVRGSDYSSMFKVETRDATGELVATTSLTLVHSEAPPES